jgi:CubicO group peptidase (beta-lactamase class C family)
MPRRQYAAPVTTFPVEKPEVLGIVPERVDALLTRIRREIDEGVLPSCQLALARDGRLAVFETLGQATPETRYVIFSCTKAIVAGAAWLLIGAGELDPSKRVVDYIPEFGSNGKDVVTVEQVMLHTSGFPHAPLGPPAWADRQERIEAFGRWRLNWEPGSAFEYHPTSAHWVLAELIQRLSGQDYREFIRTRIAEPLGLRLGLGIPGAEQTGIAPLVNVGEPPTPEELEAVLGIPSLPITEVTDEALLSFNEPANVEVGVPGGGGVMTAADLALYYQALLHNPGGLWDAGVLADVTGRVRNTFEDPWTGVPANRALGVIVAGDDGKASMRGFGKTNSPRAFGHGGAGGQIGWADPETGISLCYLTNGLDRNPIRQGKRGVAISSLAALCTTPL